MEKLVTQTPFTFHPESHTYRTADGTRLPSVTEVIRFLTADRAADARPWIRDEAARRGTAVHSLTALLDYGEPWPEEIHPELWPYLTAYSSFLRDYRPNWDYIELPLASLDLGFAGTVDRIGSFGGELVLVDLKTTGSTPHRQSLAAQLTAYAQLCLSAGLSAAPRHYGLHLRRDGTYRLLPVDPAPELLSACLTIHRALAPRRVPAAQRRPLHV